MKCVMKWAPHVKAPSCPTTLWQNNVSRNFVFHSKIKNFRSKTSLFMVHIYYNYFVVLSWRYVHCTCFMLSKQILVTSRGVGVFLTKGGGQNLKIMF